MAWCRAARRHVKKKRTTESQRAQRRKRQRGIDGASDRFSWCQLCIGFLCDLCDSVVQFYFFVVQFFFSSIRYSFVIVRTIRLLPATAGQAIHISSSLFRRTISNFGPAATTKVSPSS